MTGYASVQSQGAGSENPRATAAGAGDDSSSTKARAGAARLGLEIRSVNSRFLDLSFRLSEELRHIEPALRELLTTALKRGKVEVRAYVEQASNAGISDPSPALLQRLNSAQDSIRAWLPSARELSVADVLRLASADTGAAVGTVDYASATLELAGKATQELLAARAREGERLVTMLLERITTLRALATSAAPLVPQLVEQQRQKFLERWREALSTSEGNISAQTAQDRALTEATAFAIRIDVAEEITRLAAHLDELERLLRPDATQSTTDSKKGSKATTANVEIGKRLDFLIQELHREANTLGSKSSTLEMTRISLDMKVLIEQMREQVQNIE